MDKDMDSIGEHVVSEPHYDGEIAFRIKSEMLPLNSNMELGQYNLNLMIQEPLSTEGPINPNMKPAEHMERDGLLNERMGMSSSRKRIVRDPHYDTEDALKIKTKMIPLSSTMEIRQRDPHKIKEEHYSKDGPVNPLVEPAKHVENGGSSRDHSVADKQLQNIIITNLVPIIKKEEDDDGYKINDLVPLLHTSAEIKNETFFQPSGSKELGFERSRVDNLSTHFGTYSSYIALSTHEIGRTTNKRMTDIPGERPFCCKLCPVSFSRKDYLKRHIMTHSGEKPFSCHQCHSSFKQKGDLKKHIMTHSRERPFSCIQCHASFKRKGDLKKHIMTHSGEKPFSCNQCLANFSQKGNLNQHIIQTHSDEKPFSCHQCHAFFKQKADLKRHIITHSGEKPFSCNQCHASFKQKGGLKNHIITHSGEKPFSCNQCHASFKQKRGLKNHIITHSCEKRFSCNQCLASFKRKGDLKRHIMTHSGEKLLS